MSEFAWAGFAWLFLMLWGWVDGWREKRAERPTPEPPRRYSHAWWREMWWLASELHAQGEPGHAYPMHAIMEYTWHRAWDRRLRLEREEGIV